MTNEEFRDQDLSGASFEDVRLTGATFRAVYLDGVTFRNVDLTGAKILGADVIDVEITGDVEGLTVNGVDVGPFVEAELDRRQPGRAKMRPTDLAGFREGWELVQARWAETIERARGLEPDRLHERVAGEWSFTETLRHLAYATDVWVSRAILGDPRPWHALSLPFDEMDPHPEVPWDREARPSLDEVLELRASRTAVVRQLLDDLTEERLAGETTPVEGPSWPPAKAYPVAMCLRVVLNEEWCHRQYAERDLDVLTGVTGVAGVAD